MNTAVIGRLRRQLTVLAGLCCAAASLGGSPGHSPPHARPLTVLQMNLCNSGAAGCYTGRAVAQAATVIRAERPDVVSLNEICEPDVGELATAMGAAHPGGMVLTAFEAAMSLRTGKEVRCNNGQLYGVGLLVQASGKHPEFRRTGGYYPMQTRGEQRVWTCLYVSAAMQACTTHLALGTNGINLAQCQYLVGTAVPTTRAEDAALPTVVAGDLNLGAADSLPCLPPDYSRTDDGAVQQVMASASLVIGSSRTIDMHGATDHPGLIVTLSNR